MTPEARAAATAALAAAAENHDPVLCAEVIAALSPQDGDVLLDGTFGAGGYARALLDAADCRVIGLDRDVEALAEARIWAPLYEGRLSLIEGTFGVMDDVVSDAFEGDVNRSPTRTPPRKRGGASDSTDRDDIASLPMQWGGIEGGGAQSAQQNLAGIVLDIGVSSMQLDRARRGFSFLRDGPLDMRMGQQQTSAADIVNAAEEAELADLFFQYGEERRSRALARAVVDARSGGRIETTSKLAAVIETASPAKRPGQPHPATRVFQALRIAVNDELGELARGLAAAERLLGGGGRLVVVTFHSLEDRIVKRFFQQRAAQRGSGVSRHQPDAAGAPEPSFELLYRKPVTAGADELSRNPRARSAKLRAARRTAAAAHPFTGSGLGLPRLAIGGVAP